MKTKKFISIFLVLIFVLQLLPIRQAINYFFIDNQMTEEIVPINKSATKNINTPDEDFHFINDHLSLFYTHLAVDIVAMGLYKEMLLSSHADDIETPPPNLATN
ncbi:MAG: hypothetical protein LH478_11215 [Chitinophagaceae bacterium]|nr:hypothetical protein [Chitinophagaceae bacterium]